MMGGENIEPVAISQAGIEGQLQEDLLNKALEAFTIPQEGANGDGATASLPPAMAAMHGKSKEEILAELNKTPLFMTELEENDELEAFKALAYEGTPAEVALNFKEQGNDCFKVGKWADAKEFYSKGIQVLQAEQRKRAKDPKHDSSRTPEEREQLQVLETSLVNRAACHLSLHNYRSCTLDCALVLRFNPSNIKALYRSSRALLALSKIPEADDVCARGLALDPSNTALKNVAEQIIAKNAEIESKKAKQVERERKRLMEERLLRAALKARGIRTRKTAQPPELEDAKVKLIPDPEDPMSELLFPTVLLYPLHLQSDFIKDFTETETLGSRLMQILAEPASWDREGEYTYKGVECYMETLTGGLIKVGKNITLLKVLSGGNVEVVDDVVRIFVVPKGKAGAWVQEFKAKKAAEYRNG